MTVFSGFFRGWQWLLLVFCLLFGAGAANGQESVLISEFMALNTSTLADPNGAYPDWLELYNPGSNAVNLAGWCLTDERGNLTKWRFPTINIAGYGYLVVFASGTSQTDIAIPLSTNFRLNGSGEYLALVKPDGVTVAWEYAAYPGQVADISYGLAMELASSPLLIPGDSGQVLIPSEPIDPSWREPGYDDSSWNSVFTGVGYDNGTNYQDIIAGEIGWMMQSINASAYLRLPFNVADPSVFRDLRLRLRYDDGFVAYLNGVEVARSNAPALLSWDSAATAVHGLPIMTEPVKHDFDDPGTVYTAKTFQGSFTPMVLGPDAGSAGKFLRLANMTNDVQTAIIFDRTATGAFNTVVATFDFRMTTTTGRADGMGFAFVPTALYGTNGVAIGPFNSWGEEPNLAGALGVGFDIYKNTGEPNANHVSLHYNGALVSTPVMPPFDLANGNFHRAQITLVFAGGNALVTVRLTPNIFRGAGPTATLFNNLVVPGVAPYEGRVAFAARTGGEYANQDVDNVNVQFVASGVLQPEEFNLTSYLGSLHAGENVLAIQGLNITAEDTDFVLLPELTAAEITIATNEPSYFATATPGAPNIGGAPAVAPRPEFLLAGGAFTNDVSVDVSIDSPGTEIHYTLDGSEPTDNSTLYTGPIALSSSTTVRARGFGPRVLPSEIVSQAYTLLDNDVKNFTSNLPLVIINTFGNAIVQENKIAATMSFIDTFRGRSSVRARADLQVRAGIEIRGQSSTMFDKKSYGFETRDEKENDLHVPLLGLPSNSDWVLYAPYNDKTFMNDVLAFELHEKMGHYAVRRRFVEVFVDHSGGRLNYPQDYAGIYVLLEKIKIGPERVAIAALKPGDNSEPNISGGYIFKKDNPSPGDINFTTATKHQVLTYHDPKGADLTPAQRSWLLNYVNQFERALYSTNTAGTNHYAYYIDVDSFVDQHWIVEYTKNIDGYRLSDYFYKDRGGKLFMAPIWDWNLSFGNADYLQGWQTNGWYYAQNGTPLGTNITEAEHIWLRQLVGLPSGARAGDPDFKQKITDRWGVLRTNIFATSNVLARVDEIAASLNEAQARDFLRWPRLGVPIWPNPADYWPITTYQGTVDWMKRWIAGRFSWIESQYPLVAPLFNHPGGAVVPGFYFAISATNSVYFTLDGSDPRLPGGMLATNALLYNGPFPVTNNIEAFARVRISGGAWSPPSTVSLFTRIPALVITEIMYHPQDPPAGSPYSQDAFEYLELKNIGATAINLRNARLSGSIDFTFPNLVLAAGGQIVVVKNRPAFQTRYGPNIPVVGDFSGHLGNKTDHLVLTGPLGEPILDFSYQDDWQPITDGPGFALVIVDENAPLVAWGLKSSWRASRALNGSPGLNDPSPIAFPTVLINEALTHPDPLALATIELYNASGTTAQIGGWFLTDDFNTPKKFRIPNPTSIAAGNFLLFNANNFGAGGGLGIPFALDADGGQVYLFSADANTNLTGYVHGFSFGAQREGVTFGRYVTSTGGDHFVAQNGNTLGLANHYPMVGPVVISEIMYGPPEVWVGTNSYDNIEDEFIELLNVTDSPVELYDPDYPANTWKLDQAVHYTFPQGTVIPERGFLLLVSFDPVNNPSQLAAFKAKYDLSPGLIPILGPYSGKLKNSDDSVELKRPDTPELAGEVPYVLVDKVHYDDKAPWPAAANGLGFSLQRVEPSEYGDDPMNWQAGPSTPGASYLPAAPPTIVTQPQGRTAFAGDTVTLSVDATGPSLSYQWRFKGENIPGATSAALPLNNLQIAASGEYQVIVLTPSSSTLSSNAVLTVIPRLHIATQPQTRAVRLSSLTNVVTTNVSFFVSTLGGGPALTYQWRFNGSNIPGATNPIYVISKISITNYGVVQVLVSDGFTPLLSEPANLNVGVIPVVIQTLTPYVTALQGETVSWTVSVYGFPQPFNFQWRRPSGVLTNLSLNSTTCTFTVYNVQPSNSSLYRVVITNVATPTNDVPANSGCILTVLADSNANHIADEWEKFYGFNLNDPNVANDDPDRDGMTNLQEYLAGTDPTNGLSVLKLEPISLGGVATLRFAAIADKSYSVQYKNALANVSWLKLADVGARSTNWTATVFDSITNRSRYYRVVTSPP